MDTALILSIISIVTTSIVGRILYKQIKSQTDLINHYKGYAEAIDPKKIIALHDQEVTKLQKLTTDDIRELKTQLVEMGWYVDNRMTDREISAKQNNYSFDRQSEIREYMPRCINVLNVIREHRQSNTPNAQ